SVFRPGTPPVRGAPPGLPVGAAVGGPDGGGDVPGARRRGRADPARWGNEDRARAGGAAGGPVPRAQGFLRSRSEDPELEPRRPARPAGADELPFVVQRAD